MNDGLLWSLVTVGGPILLAAALLWAILHNRTSRRQHDATERATDRLYAAEDRARDRGDDEAP